VSSELGDRIRRLRVERGLSQSELAGARLSESYVSLIESGRRRPAPKVIEYLAERFDVSSEILTGVTAPPDAAAVELLVRRGEWETDSGRPAAARGHLEQGVKLAEQLGLIQLATRGRMAMAKALEVEGRLGDAVEQWEELLARSERDPRNVPARAVTVGLSRCCRELGDLDRAIEVGERYWSSVDTSELSGVVATEDAVVVGATLLTAYLELGNQQRCRELAASLVQLAETVDAPMATGAAYWNAALAAEAEGRIAEALLLAERAQASMALTQDVRNRARLQVVLGGLHLRAQPPDTAEAVRLLTAAESVLGQFGSTVDLGYCRTELARAHLQNHQYERACKQAQSTIEGLEGFGEAPIELARTLMVLAAAESALRRHEAARAHAQRAADLLERAGASRQAASRWTELAELCVQLGDSAAAIDAFRRATDLLGAKKTAGAAGSQAVRRPDLHQAEAS
jgi:tetratricopeptide (TPR) repeat protein